MQHIIVHGKNNPYSDLYLIILMIALEFCWWWLLIEHSLCPHLHLYIPPCAPGVPVVVVSLCPSRHLYSRCPGVPVCNFSLSVPAVIYIPCVPVLICVLVSRSVVSSYNDVIHKALYTYNDVICKPTNKQTCIHTTYFYIYRYSFFFIFLFFSFSCF